MFATLAHTLDYVQQLKILGGDKALGQLMYMFWEGD